MRKYVDHFSSVKVSSLERCPFVYSFVLFRYFFSRFTMLSRVILSYHRYVVLNYQKSAKNKTPSNFRAPFNFRATKKTIRAPLIFAHPWCANLPPLIFARPWCAKIKGARKFKGIRYSNDRCRNLSFPYIKYR